MQGLLCYGYDSLFGLVTGMTDSLGLFPASRRVGMRRFRQLPAMVMDVFISVFLVLGYISVIMFVVLFVALRFYGLMFYLMFDRHSVTNIEI